MTRRGTYRIVCAIDRPNIRMTLRVRWPARAAGGGSADSPPASAHARALRSDCFPFLPARRSRRAIATAVEARSRSVRS